MIKQSKKEIEIKALEDLTVFLLSELLDSKYFDFQKRIEDLITEKITSLKSVDLRKVLMDKDRVLIVDANLSTLTRRVCMLEDKLKDK